METWETAPVETLTPKQRRRRDIADRQKQLRTELGITDYSNFGRTSDWKALDVLATEDAAVRQIVSAVYWLDRDGGTDIGNYSHAAANTDRVRLAQAPDAAVRLEGEAMEAMLEGSPRTVVRRLLLERLRQMGVKLPNDHLYVCRWLYEAFQSRPAFVGRPDLTEYLERCNKTLAEYGVSV